MKKLSFKSLIYLLASKRMEHILCVSKSSLIEYKFYNKVKDKSVILQNVLSISEIHKKSFQNSSEKVESDILKKLFEAQNKNESFDEALKSNNLFKELKINYINYSSSLEKVNKLIGVCNNIQKSVLNMYDDFNSKYFEFTNNILNIFYANQTIKDNLISKNRNGIKEMKTFIKDVINKAIIE